VTSSGKNIHPIFDRLLTREEKESRFRQRAHLFWLYGLSGSGKSTLAAALERELFKKGFSTHLLDGDNVRTGLNRDLGFSEEDRTENIRRIAEVSRLLLQAGLVVINSFITPFESNRETARNILGDDLSEVFVDCSFEVCAKRDVKGLYAKARAGKISSFTGKDSPFEEPKNPDLRIDTEEAAPEESLRELLQFVLPKIQR